MAARRIDARGPRSRRTSRCSGWAFVLKRQRGALSNFTGIVSTWEPRVVLSGIPNRGSAGCSSTATCGSRTTSGQVLAERAEPARRPSSGRRNLWWDDLDLLYFGAYALWGYLNAPFVFRAPRLTRSRRPSPGARTARPGAGCGSASPTTCPRTHASSATTSASDGLLRRNDYTAEVFGGWAKATHYCWDHRDFDGARGADAPEGAAARTRPAAGAGLRPGGSIADLASVRPGPPSGRP